MAYWGRSTTNGSAFTTAFQRAMGGTFVSTDQVLSAVEIYCSGDGSAQLRVAVYVGGTAADPTGATLLEDMGVITPAVSAGWIVANSGANPTIPANSVVWIYLHGTSSTSVYASTSSADSGDFSSARGRADFSSTAKPASEAPPATLPGATFSSFWYAFRLDYSAAGPTITSINTDNTGDQYEAVTANVTDFAGNITSFILDDGTNSSAGVVIDGDITGGAVSLRLPGDLPTGTYAATLSNASESANLSFEYTQTHPVNIPSGLYDSRSILVDQGLGTGYAGDVWMDNPGAPYEIDGEGGVAVVAGEVMTFKAPYTDWTDAPIQNDIDDFLEAPESFTGWMRADFQRLYPDGTIDSWSAEFQVALPPQVASVTVPANATYGEATELQFTVICTINMLVTGTPRLALDFEGATRYANYVSGSGTDDLVFTYTVQEGDYAPNGVGVVALELNGGTIRDSLDRDLMLGLNSVGDAAAVLAGTAPHLAVSIESMDVGSTSATIVVSYPGTNLTGYQYDIGAGWVNSGSTINLSDLTGETSYPFDVRPVNEFGGGNATSTQFITEPEVDTTPDDWTFTAQSGVARSAVVESNTMTVLGVEAGVDVPVTITGGSYQVSTDGGNSWGGWTSAATNVRLNYRIRVRHTSSALHGTNTDTALTVGGVTRTFRSTTLADTEKPVISLVGGNVTIEQGSVWVDPGYTATDNADGDLTAEVVVTGTIDTNLLEPPQTLTYYVEDAAGNFAQTTRTVTVVEDLPDDVTAPVITLNGGNSTLRVGEVWVEPGYTATDNVDGDLTDLVQIDGSVSTAEPDVITLTYSVPDAAGNIGTATRTVTVLPVEDYPLDSLAPSTRTLEATRVHRPEIGSKTFVMKAGEELDFDFDLTQWLTDQGDDSVSPGSLELTEEAEALEVLRSGLVPSTGRVKVWLGASAASPGESYPVQLKISTLGSRTAIFQFRMIVI